jgi:branched-chain amino acid transport system ATP-binding protein
MRFTFGDYEMLLEVEKIHTFLGKSHILQGISLGVGKGETVTLLGRNGVGKSTTLKSIMGLVSPQKGSIQFNGKELIGLRPYEICRLGVGYIPEERRIFPNLSVRENLMTGIKAKIHADNRWTIERVYSNFPQLEQRDRHKGRHLSGGEQQMLTIGRTLMGNPQLLLVDEPTEGLAPALVEMVIKIINEINMEGISILLVEQAMDVAFGLAKRTYLMSKGEIVFQGTREEFYADGEVRKKYLEV